MSSEIDGDPTTAPDASLWRVAVDTPRHSGLDDGLVYRFDGAVGASPQPGALLRVPLGRRVVTGVAWDGHAEAERPAAAGEGDVRSIVEVLDALPPLDAAWRALVEFAAGYYQRGLGELALSVLPPALRALDGAALGRRLARRRPVSGAPRRGDGAAATDAPDLSPAQADAVRAIAEAPRGGTVLLHGVTGSGKTEVYLHAVADVVARGGQALVLVPEINLTPQLEARFVERFGAASIVAQHSAMTPARRLAGWLAALRGDARIVLGTRLAIFTPLADLRLIVVDEEHDPSYKAQDGARFSARDLAVYRGRLQQAAVVLGSATPSLETWANAEAGRYRRVTLPSRIGASALPEVRLCDLGALPRASNKPAPVLAPPVLAAVLERIDRGEQSLMFLNRRGYAPVLHCASCGWKSDCPHCSAWRVFHKAERTLRCHHCGFGERVPRACPVCGDVDLAPIGRGTEKLEEQLVALLPGARIARLDADTARGEGALERRLADVHGGEVDVLVGTQMVTKGHDFRRITLVVAVNPDGALFSSDFRAAERQFALLMQAAGRAGRDAAHAGRAQMWVQTWNPAHPLYQALTRHDYAAFAASQLAEREAAGLPPSTHLALLRAEARDGDAAEAFLAAAAAAADDLPPVQRGDVVLYPAVPSPMARVAGLERRQMLVESARRAPLQAMLASWTPRLHALRKATRGLARWAVDVDPQAI